MDLETAILAIRELEHLQPLRRIELIRLLISAPTTGVWPMVVAKARAEDVEVEQARRAEVSSLLREKFAEAARRNALEALRAPVKASGAPVGTHAGFPGSRPGEAFICPPDHRHGDAGTCYSHHRCRCSECRENKAQRIVRAKGKP